jgi:pimeloyl-ACP methyl ester carboxylesterase
MTEFKPQRWKRRLLGLCVALTGGFILLNVVAYRNAYAMIHYETGKPRTSPPEILSLGQKVKVLLSGVNIPRPHSDMAVTALGAAARSLQIPGDGAVKLGAWYCPAASNSPLVILFHGYTAEKSGLVGAAKIFLELGCSVLLVDFRGSGDSSESYSTIGYLEAEDVAAAVRYAQRNLSPSKIVLYGQSMGGAAIFRAIASCGVKPDAIIVEAIFDRLLKTMRHRFEAMKTPSFPSAELLIFWGGMQEGFNGFKHNPVEYARGVACPALFLHGTADPRAHLEEARQVFAAVPGSKRFKEFPGAGHFDILARYPGEWQQEVGDFLQRFMLVDQRLALPLIAPP